MQQTPSSKVLFAESLEMDSSRPRLSALRRLGGAASTRDKTMRLSLSLVVAVLVASCVVPPSCLTPQRGAAARHGHLVTVILFSQPAAEAAPTSQAAGVLIWEHFERAEIVVVDGKGGMSVSAWNSWPDRCLRIPQEDLARLRQHWRLFLEQVDRSHTALDVMTDPYTGDGWRAYGPVLSFTFGSPAEKSFGLLWDGQLRLPEDLDTAVISTLEAICSNSRLAKKRLLGGLPRQVADRLECPTE